MLYVRVVKINAMDTTWHLNVSLNKPSKILKELAKANTTWSEKDIEELAKKCLLDTSDVTMWPQNLNNGKKKVFGLLLLTIAKQKNVENNKNNENDENDEEEVYCICMQPWGNRLVT